MSSYHIVIASIIRKKFCLIFLIIQKIIDFYRKLLISFLFCVFHSDGCKISSIWDSIQPEYQNNVQLCADLFQRANLNFLKIYINDHFMILKIFERFQIDLNLIQVQMQEKNM